MLYICNSGSSDILASRKNYDLYTVLVSLPKTVILTPIVAIRNTVEAMIDYSQCVTNLSWTRRKRRKARSFFLSIFFFADTLPLVHLTASYEEKLEINHIIGHDCLLHGIYKCKFCWSISFYQFEQCVLYNFMYLMFCVILKTVWSSLYCYLL